MFKPSLKILSMSVELKTPPGEAIAERPPHWRKENFIPVRKAELVDLLTKQPGLSAVEQSDFRQFCRLLECLYHYEFHQQLEDLKNAYAPFDPDADTQAIAAARPPAAEQQLDGLFDKFV